MTFSANLGLDYVQAAQAQKHITMNEALSKLDVLVMPVVQNLDFQNPPGTPVEGDSYIVASPAGGVWATHENDIASYLNGSWVFYTPRAGWRVYVLDEDTPYDFDGTDWVIKSITAAALSNGSLLELGVNSGTTSTNRLSVKSDNVLLSHDDVMPGTGDMNLTINKDVIGSDASITLQTGFSARVIAGLLGDDDFTFRISDDGTTFNNAFVIDGTSGSVSHTQHPKFSGYCNYNQYNEANSWFSIDINNSRHNDQSSLASGTFTAPHDGYYAFGSGYRFLQNVETPTEIRIGFSVNGAAPTPDRYVSTFGGGWIGTGSYVNATAVIKLNSGDSVNAAAFFETNDGFVDSDKNYFHGYQIS